MRTGIYPEARIDGATDVYHGVTVPDPYRWLEDNDSPETRKWIEGQNNLKNKFLESSPELDAISRKLETLLRVPQIDFPLYEFDGMSPVFCKGGRYFYSAFLPEKNQSAICVVAGLDGEQKILLDPNGSDPAQSLSYQIKAVSEDGSFLVYGVREGGEDEQILKFYEVDSGRHLPYSFPRGNYTGVELLPSAKSFYYTMLTPAGPRTRFHRVGAAPEQDEETFGNDLGLENWIDTQVSPDGAWLVIFVYNGAGQGFTRGIYLRNLKAGGKFVPIVEGVKAYLCGQIIGSTLYLRTTWNSPNGKVLAVDLDDPLPDKWKEIIPEKSAALDYISLAGGRIFAAYLDNAASRVDVFDTQGKLTGSLKTPPLGTVSKIWGGWERGPVFFTFESFVHPKSIQLYHPSSGKQETWFTPDLPVNAGDLEVKQVWYASKDKTKVPMFLVHKKGIELDGNNPTLLSGYGGFSISNTPGFDGGNGPLAYLFAEMGGVYAMANIRGGGEFGEAWHKAGMLQNKQNCFDDFIAAAEWLQQNGYTRPSRTAIAGGSNGGLLMGAMITQRPDLFKAVLCAYPLLDMIRYEKFYVAPMWAGEYGSPDDPDAFRWLLKYSPYHNVKDGTAYPAALFITGDSDTRVHPLHARKMAARLQAATGSDNPVLLTYDTLSGHFPGGSLKRKIESLAEKIYFLRKLIF